MQFTNLNLIPQILNAIKVKGYTTPTPIQAQAIPVLLQGRDLMGCAQTGTGKTAAFAIPILQRLQKEKESGRWSRDIKALIITPTRELAIQIDESFTDYGQGLGFRHTVIFGGVKQFSQVRKLRSGIDILVATPGRLLDLINQKIVNLQNLKFFVLDEADRMLDMGFVHDVKKIISKLPPKRQSLFFSATMPPSITGLAETLLTNPACIKVTPTASTAETVTQHMYLVDKKDKRSLLTHILQDPTVITSALVFTRTKHGADKIARFINESGIRADAIHSNKSQNARQNILKKFKNKETRVLVATDIAARGIDIDELSHVINFEIPNEPETYVHRIGRTGRAKKSGIALSFCDKDEQGFVRDIHKLISQIIPVIEEHPYHTNHSGSRSEKTQTERIKQGNKRKHGQQIQRNKRTQKNQTSRKNKRPWQGRKRR
ncbi:DEAD/DEAH box helicase [Candidatus Gracilibacteria bacterium]|nr:DEAD/DEAH box helicase [Candidatus Gracilibacteria bacterium]